MRRLAVALFCCIWLTGCVSALTQKLGRAKQDEPSKATTGLIKPQITDEPEIPKPSDSGKGEDAKPGVVTRVSEDRPRGNESQQQAKAVDLKEKPKTRSLTEDKPEEETSLPSTRDVGNGSRSLAPDLSDKARGSDKQKIGAKASSGSDATKEAADDHEGDLPPLEKHDHAKYVQLIRTKAIDTVNKEKDVTLARLCRDSTTEEWTLTLYQRRKPNYSFVTYMWDEVDAKWERAFSSGTRPISGWKQHLDFSSAGKDCKVLKGTAGD